MNWIERKLMFRHAGCSRKNWNNLVGISVEIQCAAVGQKEKMGVLFRTDANGEFDPCLNGQSSML